MIVGWMRPGKPVECIRCDRTLVRTNLTCMNHNTFVWLTLICANACLLCCGASLFFLQCMIVHVTEGIPLGGGCFMRLCSPAGMAAMHVFFSHRRNGGNAVLWGFVPQCLQLGQLAVHTRVRPRWWPHIETPWPRPLSPIPTPRLLYPTPTPTKTQPSPTLSSTTMRECAKEVWMKLLICKMSSRYY